MEHRREGKAAGDSSVTADMLRLALEGVLEAYRDIANAALQGGCAPDSWKRGIMLPIENGKGR